MEFFRDRIIIDFGLGRECGWVLLWLVRNGFGHLLDPPNGLSLFDVLHTSFLPYDKRSDLVCWKDALKGTFSIRCAWIRLVQDKMEW